MISHKLFHSLFACTAFPSSQLTLHPPGWECVAVWIFQHKVIRNFFFQCKLHYVALGLGAQTMNETQTIYTISVHIEPFLQISQM